MRNKTEQKNINAYTWTRVSENDFILAIPYNCQIKKCISLTKKNE